MSEKLTVAELLARNAKEGSRRNADRPRRRRNIEDGGVSVSELTGSIPVVRDEHLAEDGGVEDGTGIEDTADVAATGAEGSQDAVPADRAEVESAPEEPVVEQEHHGTHGLDGSGDTTDADGAVADADLADADGTDTGQESGVDVGDAETTLIPKASIGAAGAGATAGVAGAASFADAPESPEAEPVVAPDDAVEGADAEGADAEGADAEGTRSELTDDGQATDDEDATGTDDSDEDASAEGAGADDEIVEYEDDAISWPALIGQSVIALAVGVLIFFGFTLLWDKLAAGLVLAMAVVVTLVCVGIVHALLRHRDTLVLVLAFIVGLAITLGPRLVMSI